MRTRISAVLTFLALILWQHSSINAAPGNATGDLLVKFRPAPPGNPVVHPEGMVVRKELRNIGWCWVQTPPGTSVDTALGRYRRMPEVVMAEAAVPVRKLAIPNDPRYTNLWGMDKIAAPKAWDVSKGSRSIVVGVIDTGIDFSHPDLTANAWVNAAEIPGNSIDDDQNGYVDDVHGIDVVESDGDPFDDDGHGTHVAGTIGAVGDNGTGVAGICWNVSLMGVRIGAADGFSTTAEISAAFDYIVGLRRKGVNLRVVNNSWGNDYPSRAIYDAMALAAEAGILVVCAAGNDGLNNDLAPHYPSGFDVPGMISVAASDPDDQPAGFSNYGRYSVHLAAPGVDILSTLKGGRFYASFQGTSMASPHVAGAAALILSRRPDLTVGQLRTLLMESVDRIPAWEGRVISGGRLNVARALERAVAGGAIAENFTPPPATGTVEPVVATPGPAWSRITRGRDGRSASAGSSAPALSADGRFVAFVSSATNLVEGAVNGFSQVYLHDRLSNTVVRISQNANLSPGNGDSAWPSISGDGRYLVFMSDATNLATEDRNARITDIFLYDRLNLRLSIINLADGFGPANGDSLYPVISADGRWVAFESQADNLSADDFNFNTDVFLFDRLGVEPMERVSASQLGTRFDDESYYPSISADGRYVGFTSVGQLLAEDRNGFEDVYVFDRVMGLLERASVTSTGQSANGSSSFSALSGDGRYVAFESNAPNLLGGDNGTVQIIVRDRTAKTTRLATAGPAGGIPESDSFTPVLSFDGRFMVFYSNSRRLDSNNGSVFYQMYLADRVTGRLGRVTYTEAGAPAGEDSFYSSMSRDGRLIAFGTRAFNLVPADGNAATDILLLDLGAQRPDLMLTQAGGILFEGGGVVHPGVPQRAAVRVSSGQTGSFDIRLENAGVTRSAFRVRLARMPEHWSTRLTARLDGGDITALAAGAGWSTPELDPGAGLDLRLESTATAAAFIPSAETVIEVLGSDGQVRDRVRAVVTAPFFPPGAQSISRAGDGSPGEALSRGPVSSGSGERFVFQSESATLFPGDDNFDTDIFSYERSTGRISLISQTSGGVLGNGGSDGPTISADGRLVAFNSRATNFVTRDRNRKPDVFVKNLDNRTIRRVSITPNGTEVTRGSDAAQISADGQVVVFQSMAPELIPGDQNRAWDVFLHDLRTTNTLCLSRNAAGRTGNAQSEGPQVSGDGRWVAFSSYASDLVANDENEDEDVFLVEVATGTIELVSRRSDGRSPAGTSSLISMSTDGRWILFDSTATDLLDAGQAAEASLFLYDRTTRKIEPVAPKPPGFSGTPAFASGALSPDGRWIALNSSTPGLVPQDTNSFNDVFLWDRQTGGFACISLVGGQRAADGPSFGARFSGDGRFVMFRSQSPGLLGEGSDNISQVFFYDTASFRPALTVQAATGRIVRLEGSASSASTPLRLTLPASPGDGAWMLPIHIENLGSAPESLLIRLSGLTDENFRLRPGAGGPVLTDASQAAGWLSAVLAARQDQGLLLELPRIALTDARTNLIVVSSAGDPLKTIRLELVFEPDSDSDGLIDNWERQVFGNLTTSGPDTDRDGDGVTDGAEYEAGTDPLSAASRLILLNPERDASGTVRLNWASSAGRIYQVERAVGSPQDFRPVATGIEGTPPRNTYSETSGVTGDAVFYRIRLNFP